MTSSAIRAAGGASATHGDLALTSKNTDPDSCTAERTSDSASVLIDTTPRRTTDSSATPPDPKARPQNDWATIAGRGGRARGPASKEAQVMRRGLTPAALVCDLSMRFRQVGTRRRLLCARHSQFPLWREKPEHCSNQQERRHVASQMTYLMSIIRGLCRHDAGVDNV